MSVLDAFSLAGRVSVVTGGAEGQRFGEGPGEAGGDVVLLVTITGAAHLVEELQALGVTASAVSAGIHRTRARPAGSSGGGTGSGGSTC